MVKSSGQKKRNCEMNLKKNNPEKFDNMNAKKASSIERNQKKEAILKSNIEIDQSRKDEEKKQKELLEGEIENEKSIALWEDVRKSEILKGEFNANFRINSIFYEQRLVLHLFEEVNIVTKFMLSLLWLIFNERAYISSGVETNVLDQYKDDSNYTVIFEGRSMERTTEPFSGTVVYGERIGKPVKFSDTYTPHLFLPGIVMKKLILKGFVIPILYGNPS